MKKTFIYVLGALFCMTLGLSSCTDYLDRDEQTVLSKEDAFKNFKNFQGYVEVMYKFIRRKRMIDFVKAGTVSE